MKILGLARAKSFAQQIKQILFVMKKNTRNYIENTFLVIMR